MMKVSKLDISDKARKMQTEDAIRMLEVANSAAGIKFDTDKPDMSLLSTLAITELAKVLSFGKVKYAAHNWRKGITTSRLIAAMLRHIFAYLGGENKDPETGLSHMAHAMCCCMFILELAVIRPELDDRFVDPKSLNQ